MPRSPASIYQAVWPAERIHRFAIAFLVTFLLVFPKGGIKVGPVPITWGYLGLAPFAAVFALLLFADRPAPLARSRILALAAMVPFQLIVWASFLTFGVEGFAWAVALVVATVFLPLTFVLFLAPYLDALDLSFLFRLLRWGVLVVAAYGIILFVLKLTTGQFIEIPYLTVNQGDLGSLEGKNIDRGGVFKLISTYNNGNLYGISLLLILPLFTCLNRGWLGSAIVKGSLVLTLSRTVWIGLVLNEVFSRAYVRRLTVRGALVLGGGMVALAAAVGYVTNVLLGKEILRFLLDPNLGGRARQLDEVSVAVLPNKPFSGMAEIVYAAVLDQFGILGLAAFVVALATPLALHLLGCAPNARSELKRSLAAGVAIYLIIALSDGALLLIPVMAFYWFTVSLLLSSNPQLADGPGRAAGQIWPQAATLRAGSSS